jgi:thiamine monophosphate synthase
MNLFKDELNRAERAVGPDVCVVSAERLLNSTTPRLRANRNEIVEGIKALEDLGVTWITLRPSGDSAAEIIEWMSEFSSAVLDGRF